jgi:outer membrane lipoprotein SlyB
MRASLRLAFVGALASMLSACVVYRPMPVAQPVNQPVRQPAPAEPVYSPAGPGASYGPPPSPPPAAPRPQYAQYGWVRSVDVVRAQPQTSGGGALAGAILGAVIGRQFGSAGTGRAAGTAIGAVGGAIVGNEIEKDQYRRVARDHVRVVIDLERGGSMVFAVPDDGGLHPGERVRIENNQIFRL